MKSKKIYEAPVVEQMQCKVERGFAGSGDSPDPEPQHGTQELGDSGNSYTFD